MGDFFHIPPGAVQVQWAFVGARPVNAGLRMKIGSGGSRRVSLPITVLVLICSESYVYVYNVYIYIYT